MPRAWRAGVLIGLSLCLASYSNADTVGGKLQRDDDGQIEVTSRMAFEAKRQELMEQMAAGPSISTGLQNFKWNSPVGYGIAFAIVITVISWVFVGWAVMTSETHNRAAEARLPDAAKWLLTGCPGSEVGTVSEVNLYPLKGASQLSVDQARVLPSGLEGDRTVMVIRTSDRKFFSQRDNPKLSIVHAKEDSEGVITLTAPECDPLSVKMSFDAEVSEAILWDEPVKVCDQGDRAAEWLTALLDEDVRLVSLAKYFTVPTCPAFANGFESGLTDGFPVMVTTQTSLDAFNKLLKTPIPMKRFRPNIVISGTKAFAEDTWRIWRVGGPHGAVFQNVKPCSRCNVPNVIPEEGKFGDGEVISVLNKKRKGRQLGIGPWGQGNVYFGQNAVCLTTACQRGLVKVGDVVEVLEFESQEKVVGARPDLKDSDLPASAK